MKAPIQKALGVVSAGAIALGALPPISPILIISGAVGGAFLLNDYLGDFGSKLGQGDFSGANRNIGDIMTSTPGTGVNQP